MRPFVTIAATAPSHTMKSASGWFAAIVAAASMPTSAHSERKIVAKVTKAGCAIAVDLARASGGSESSWRQITNMTPMKLRAVRIAITGFGSWASAWPMSTAAPIFSMKAKAMPIATGMER
jgi:hypothetical protein